MSLKYYCSDRWRSPHLKTETINIIPRATRGRGSVGLSHDRSNVSSLPRVCVCVCVCVCVEVFDADRHFPNRPAGNPATSPATDSCRHPGELARPARGQDGSRARRGGRQQRRLPQPQASAPRRSPRTGACRVGVASSNSGTYGQCNRPSKIKKKPRMETYGSWTDGTCGYWRGTCSISWWSSPGRVAWHAVQA